MSRETRVPCNTSAGLTEDNVPLRAAPYERSVNLWFMEKGASISVNTNITYSDEKSRTWYPIEYFTDTGVKKIGYIYGDQMRIN